jgi:hypothetical protein
MLGPFYIGERPGEPLTVVVNDASGYPTDISDYVSVAIIGSGMPAGTPRIDPDNTGYIRYDFDEAFTEPGRYSVQFALTNADGTVDYTPETIFDVRAVSYNAPIINKGEVAALTGEGVTEADILRAQGVIGMAVNLDLATESTRLDASRLRLVKQAVAYQSVWMASQPDMFTRSEITSYNQDGAQATLAPSANTLAPLAKRALKKAKNRTTSIAIGKRKALVEDHEGLWRPM